MTPPRLARALIRAAAPADLAGALIDDLDETFARESARQGPRAARRWYWREALGGVRMLVRIRLDRRRSRVPAVSAGRYSFAVALRHATRRLVAARGFSATAVLTLALAFAANLTIAALVYGVLLRPLPYPDAARIVDVGHRTPGLGAARAGQSQGAWFFYRRESRSFEAIGIYNENVVNLTDGGLEAERVPIAMISVEVFDALGVRPMFGGFTREDDGPKAPPTVMLSHDLWQRRYGGDPSIVGKTVEVNGTARRVIAVMPRGFAFPTAGTGLWMRQGFDPREARFGELVYGSVARLREGVQPEAAETELNALIRRLPDEYADVRSAWLTESQLSARVEPLKLVVTREASGALWVTLAAGALVLLLGGANVTNLFLIRSEQRAREAGIARALGATSRHLFTTLLAETLLVAAAAAAIAVPIATFALNLVLARAQGLLPRLDAVAIDGVTLAGLTLIAVLTALVLAAAGLWRTRGVTLRDAGRSASASPAQARVRLALSSVQVALAFALVVTSTLLVRSVWNLIHLDKGFSADRVLTFEIALPFRGYDTFRKSSAYHATLLERLRALPGVEAAGAVTDLPLSGFTLKRYLDSLVFVERAGRAPLEVNGVNWKLATPGYFDAMRIPVLRGRWVQPGEHFDDTFPVVVSDGFSRRHLGDSPLGQRIKHYADPHWWTVVGVVGDVRDDGLRTTPAEAAYAPVLDQEKGAPFTSGSMTHVVRTTVPPESIAAAVRGVVAGLDSRVPLAEMQTMATVVSQSMARDALVLALVAVAAGLAVVMGLVGLYGALAYSIAQRRRELGVRLALGATTCRLRGDVSRAPGIAIVVGLAAGAMLTWLTSRLLSGLLFGVEAGDAATYAASAVILTATCAIAVALSLRGLRRVSALEALRSE